MRRKHLACTQLYVGQATTGNRSLILASFIQVMQMRYCLWRRGVQPTTNPLSAVIRKRGHVLTMDSKRISILLSFWLISSYILLEHSQGFETRLSSKRVRRKHQRLQQQNRRHGQSGKEMALSMFSRFVVCEFERQTPLIYLKKMCVLLFSFLRNSLSSYQGKFNEESWQSWAIMIDTECPNETTKINRKVVKLFSLSSFLSVCLFLVFVFKCNVYFLSSAFTLSSRVILAHTCIVIY